MCYNFYFDILDEEDDVMFAIELHFFSIGIITVPIHIELDFK